MVKYRQATQKPSNVCFTGRGRTGETGGGGTHTEFQCSLRTHTEDGYAATAARTIWQFVGFVWRAQSPPAKTITEPHPPLPRFREKKSFLSSRHETLSPVCLFLHSADQFINQEEDKANWFRSLCRPEPISGCFVFLGFQIFSRLSGAAKSHRVWINKSHFWDSKS